MMAKTEGSGKEWHGHITAVTVDYDYRRLGIAKDLVEHLVQCCQQEDQNCYFIDLFVRTTNKMAIDMYKLFGFDIFRRVIDYYSSGTQNDDDAEDAFDMRKPLKRDSDKQSLKKSSHTYESTHYSYKYDKTSISSY